MSDRREPLSFVVVLQGFLSPLIIWGGHAEGFTSWGTRTRSRPLRWLCHCSASLSDWLWRLSWSNLRSMSDCSVLIVIVGYWCVQVLSHLRRHCCRPREKNSPTSVASHVTNKTRDRPGKLGSPINLTVGGPLSPHRATLMPAPNTAVGAKYRLIQMQNLLDLSSSQCSSRENCNED